MAIDVVVFVVAGVLMSVERLRSHVLSTRALSSLLNWESLLSTFAPSSPVA